MPEGAREDNARPPESDRPTPAERRGLKDRRSKPTPCLSRYTFKGSRKAAMREEEARNYYVDRFEPRYLLMVGLIFLLCLIDYALTTRIQAWGGSEINVLAAGLTRNSPVVLLLLKLGVTTAGLLVLLFHKNFRFLGSIRAGDVIAFVLAVYLTLTFYELFAVLSIIRILAA